MTFLDVTLEPRVEPKIQEEYVKPRYNWLYENNINSGKTLIDLNKQQEFEYNKWRTNSSLSNHYDTVILANEMNINYHLSDEMHYHYLFYSVRKKNRYGKKKTKEDEALQKQLEQEQKLVHLIQSYYKYNTVRAREALKLLSKEQIDFIIKKQEKGGAK